MPTVRVRPAPVILLVGCTPAFIRRCNEAAVQARAIAVEADLSSFTTLASQTRARAVLMPQVIYASNAALFDAMAASAGTRVLTYPDETVTHEALVALIVGVVDSGGCDTPQPSSGH
jgi:hypothetical protein